MRNKKYGDNSKAILEQINEMEVEKYCGKR